MPLSGEIARGESFWFGPRGGEVLIEQPGGIFTFEDEGVVGLEIETIEAEVGGTAKNFDCGAVALHDQHLVVLKGLEVHALDGSLRLNQSLRRLGRAAGGWGVIAAVVDDDTKTLTNFGEAIPAVTMRGQTGLAPLFSPDGRTFEVWSSAPPPCSSTFSTAHL
jgi:hypothetical protein